MKTTISKAESYSKSLKSDNVSYKESMLYKKYGAILGLKMCSIIAKNF